MTADAGWRPMEEAPRDMTEVIGMGADGFIARTWHFAPSSRTQGWLRQGLRGTAWWLPIAWMTLPPHHMPLPPPPGEGGE